MPTAPQTVPLLEKTLAHHSARVEVPNYERGTLRPAIVHLGVGSFHRSHQAMYLDNLARSGERGWGLVGIGLNSPEMGEALSRQDNLFTVLTRGADGDRAQVVGVMTDYHFAPRQPDGALAALSDERTCAVTLTITGHGYQLHAAGDESASSTGSGPSSALGYLVEALRRRRKQGLEPFTVLSCDNMPGNGDVARTAVTSLARMRDPGLAKWINERGAFPNSMVDRITPQTTDTDREFLRAEFGIDDLWPVVTEPFSQWIIEDDFCNGRPPLDAVGVRFVDDVEPYSRAKTRLLNGTHCALGYLGGLAGHQRTHEAMDDETLRSYTETLMAEEIAPLLTAPSSFDLSAYRGLLLERLSNPRLGDELARLRRNASVKMPAHLIPSLIAARQQNRPADGLLLAVAGWAAFLRLGDEASGPPPLADPMAERLRAAASSSGGPASFLDQRAMFGHLGEDPMVRRDFAWGVKTIERDGVSAALSAMRRRQLQQAA